MVDKRIGRLSGYSLVLVRTLYCYWQIMVDSKVWRIKQWQVNKNSLYFNVGSKVFSHSYCLTCMHTHCTAVEYV